MLAKLRLSSNGGVERMCIEYVIDSRRLSWEGVTHGCEIPSQPCRLIGVTSGSSLVGGEIREFAVVLLVWR